MDNGILRIVDVWHRRSGKDKSHFNLLAKKAFERIGCYYYLSPTYQQGKKIIWNGIDGSGLKFTDHIPPESINRKNNTEMLIELVNGSIIQVVGVDNIDSIVGTNPIGCVFGEFSLQDPRAWHLLRPILKENGGWAIFQFTPRGRNHGYKIMETAKKMIKLAKEKGLKPRWFFQKLTVNDTKREDGKPVFSEEDIEEERAEGMPEELIQQEYYCSFNASIHGAYYGKIMQSLEEKGRFQKSLYDPKLKVNTAWDLGMNDAMAIIFYQVVGKEIRFIDYVEDSGEGLAHYIKILQNKPYVYEKHYAPHDIEVRELGTGISRKEKAEELGLIFETVKAPEKKEDGIEAVRGILPRVFIDEENCERVIEALKNYHKKWNEKMKTFSNSPLHDWSSNCADAVQTFALGYEEIIDRGEQRIRTEYDKHGRPIVVDLDMDLDDILG